MLKIFYLIFCSMFSLLLALPFIEWTTNLIPHEHLNEVHIDRATPELSIDTFKDSSFQRRFDKWFLENHGLWEYLVKTGNEIDFRVFRQFDSQYGTGHSFLAGNDWSIFQSLYLRDFNGHGHRKYNAALHAAKSIKLLKTFMNKRGKALLVVLSPNKLSMYPELVPARYQAPHSRGERVVTQFLKAAKEIGLEVFHTTPLLKEVDKLDPYPLFALPAAHWNSVAACAVAKEILVQADRQHPGHFDTVDCSTVNVSPRPVKIDHDLMDAINIWSPELSYRPTPYVSPKREVKKGSIKPSILYVGTSFVWGLLDIFETAEIYDERDFYYYGTTNHSYRAATDTKPAKKRSDPVDYHRLKWKRNVFSKDILVIEVNEARLHHIGFKFLPLAVQKIRNIEKKALQQKKHKNKTLP